MYLGKRRRGFGDACEGIEGGIDRGGRFDEDGMAIDGVVFTLPGAGGINGIMASDVLFADDGVAGVEALPGAGWRGPGGGGTLTGAAELWDPGMNAGSELRIDCSRELDEPCLLSAKERCGDERGQSSSMSR
jgi:hypothetical protein